MRLIKEPLGVDFYIDPRLLTKKEREAISKHIREYKEKLAKRKSRRITLRKKSFVTSKKLFKIFSA